MEINVDLNCLESCWYYYFFDSKGYRTTTAGFKSHVDAIEHAKKRFVKEIKVVFK